MAKILIAEDDRVSAKLMLRMLEPYGQCDLAANGEEAFELFRTAFEAGNRYSAVFLDIRMPVRDGQETLDTIRDYEAEHGINAADGVKVIMTTALNDSENVLSAHVSGCYAYLVKPISREKLKEVLKSLGLSPQ